MLRRLVTHALGLLGAALLAGALTLLLVARFGGAGDTGWEDLARIAGAILLTMGAGAALGLHLLALRAGWAPRPSRARLAATQLGALVGGAAGALFATITSADNMGPLLMGATSALLAGAGIVATLPMLARR